MSAGADEAETPPPAPVEAADTDSPPPLLPTGEEPTPATVAPPGTSSKALAAMGADAAVPDRSGRKARARGGPKGFLSKRGALLRDRTEIAPPSPATSSYEVNYHYANAKQNVISDGASASILTATPYLNDGDYHTLAEISVHSPDGKQIVEVGWTVDPAVNQIWDGKQGKWVGSYDPHLFVYHWVDGEGTCYNGCGWKKYDAARVNVGDRLPNNTVAQFGIQFYGGAWWVSYGSEWIGNFPGEIWGNKFTNTGQVQWFGEVASAKLYTCSDMGTGREATDYLNAGRFSRMLLLNSKEQINPTFGASSPRDPNLKPDEKMEALYGIEPQSSINFRYGGPGVVLDKEGKRAGGKTGEC
jgi:hypothetical protein